jgi:histidinol-phosphate aminotransferase
MVEGLTLDPNLLRVPVRKVGKGTEELRREYGLETIIGLSANENPLGPSPLAVEAMREALPFSNRYPGVCETEIRGKIARLMGSGFDEENVIVANGSSDILRMVCQAFLSGGGESVVCTATFPLYRLFTEMYGGKAVLVDAKDYAYDFPAMVGEIGDQTRLFFVCNPNNPTGTVLTQRQVDDLMKQVPDGVVVLFDEAYREYVEDDEYADVREYVEAGRNVLVVRTFSKVHGLAGLRVGYGVGKRELVQYLRRALSAFHVGALNLIGAAASMDDEEHMLRSREHNSREKRFLFEQFDKLGLRYVPSQCNFVLLVELGRDVQALWEALARRGLVVTPTQGYGVPDALRISIGTREEDERLVEALEQALREVPRV